VVAASIMPGRFESEHFSDLFAKGLSLVGAYFNARPWHVDAMEVTLPIDWPIRPSHTTRYRGNAISTSSGDNALILQMIALGRVHVEPLISHTATPDDAPTLFDKLGRGELLGGLITWR
jgi:threonine dehydrogenase-like Zn-dependent dehydrogenase